MGVFLKNKPSSLNTIVGNAILMLILMLALSILLVIPSSIAKLSGGDIHLVEFGDKAVMADINKLKERLESSEQVNASSILYISKSEAKKLMSAEIDEEMLGRISTVNPFRDIIQFSLNENLSGSETSILNLLSQNPLVTGVYNSSELNSGGTSLGGSMSKVLTTFLLLLFSLMAYIFYNTGISTLINENRKQLKSYSLYGAQDSFLESSLLKTQTNGVLRGWIIAVFLIFLLIYLFLGLIGLRITDISVVNLLITILLPLLFAIATNHILTKTKLSNYLKSL